MQMFLVLKDRPRTKRTNIPAKWRDNIYDVQGCRVLIYWLDFDSDFRVFKNRDSDSDSSP